MFQPKLILAPRTPKLTPGLDPPEVGTSQLTLCPSSTNSLEPSPNLVPSEVPASGHHGFVKWGHDAKITKIGVIPTRDSPGQGKANGPQGRRQDLRPISECTTWNWVRDPCGHRDMWPPIDHTGGGGEIGVPKGVNLAAQNEPISGVPPMVYLHAGLEIRSAIPYAIHPESNRDSHALGSQRSPCHSAW